MKSKKNNPAEKNLSEKQALMSSRLLEDINQHIKKILAVGCLVRNNKGYFEHLTRKPFLRSLIFIALPHFGHALVSLISIFLTFVNMISLSTGKLYHRTVRNFAHGMVKAASPSESPTSLRVTAPCRVLFFTSSPQGRGASQANPLTKLLCPLPLTPRLDKEGLGVVENIVSFIKKFTLFVQVTGSNERLGDVTL